MTSESQTQVIGRLEAAPGDVVVIHAHHAGGHEQLGEILEVVGEGEHVHFLVRWEDGRESLFYPGGDAAIRRARRHAS